MKSRRKDGAETRGIDCPWFFSTPFKSCGRVDYYCDGNDKPLKTRKIRQVYKRRFEAVLIALKLAEQGIIDASEDDIQFTIGDGSPCDRVWFCPNNPLCGNAKGSSSELVGSYFDGRCWVFVCRFLWKKKFKICDLDYVPSYLRDYVEPDDENVDCGEIVTRPLYWLINNFGTIYAEHGDLFHESSLAAFLLENWDNPAKTCALVSYCCETFDLVHNNVDDIENDCGPIPPPLQQCGNKTEVMTCSLSQNDWDRYVCPGYIEATEAHPACNWVYRIITNEPYSRFSKCEVWGDTDIFALTDESPNSFKSHEASFLRLIPSPYNDSVDVPIGYYQSQEGLLMQMIDDEEPSAFGDTELIDYFFDDIDKRELGLEKSSGFECIVHINEHFDQYESSVQSTGLLVPLKMIYDDGLINVVIKSNGSLYFNNDEILIESNASFCNITLNNVGEFVNVYQFSFDSLLFDSKSNSNVVLGINFDTENNPIGNDEVEKSIHTLDLNNNIFQHEFDLPPFAQILDFDAFDNNNYVCLIKTTEGIEISGNYIDNNSEAILIALVKRNGVLSSHIIGTSEEISMSNSCLTLTENNEYVVGVNVSSTGTLIRENETITSYGAKDILLLFYDQYFSLKYFSQYGSPDNEVVMDMYISGDILFFGGEISGSANNREIGELQIIHSGSSSTKSFISYTNISTNNYDSPPPGKIPSNLTTPEQSLFVYPNPSSGSFEIYSSRKYELKSVIVINTNGQEVFKENNIYSTRLSVSLEQVPGGIYSVIAEDINGTIYYETLIKN